MHANLLRAAMVTAARAFRRGRLLRSPRRRRRRRLHGAGRVPWHRARVRETAAAEERPGPRRGDVPRARRGGGAPRAEAGARAAPHRAAAGRHRREHHRGCRGLNWGDPRSSRPVDQRRWHPFDPKCYTARDLTEQSSEVIPATGI